MHKGPLFSFLSGLAIALLFVAARKAELSKKYKASFLLHILMVAVCLILLLYIWLTHM